MQYWVYIVRCSDGSYYSGHTDRIERRMGEHQAGLGSDWTMRRRPITLAWCEVLPTRDEAFQFERRVKGWSCVKKEALIARVWDRVSLLAQSTERILRGERPSTSLRSAQDQSPPNLPRSDQDERTMDAMKPLPGVSEHE